MRQVAFGCSQASLLRIPRENMGQAKIQPGALAPLFCLTALIHLTAVCSRFSPAAGFLPAGFAEAILMAHLPLLLVEGYFEGRINYGKALKDFPLWMRINSRPVKWSFTLAFTYLAIVVLQTWDISIGPVDPSPPESWPLVQRALWFGVMSLGMFFPNYLAASSILIPVLRVITAPFRYLPLLVAMLLLTAIGGALGYGATLLLASSKIATQIEAIQSAVTESPGTAIGVALALVWIPIFFGWIKDRKSSG